MAKDDCGCPKLKKKDWENKKHIWQKKAFYVKKHGLFLHMPIGIAGAIQKAWSEVKEKKYKFKSPYMMLDDEIGPFSARIMLAIDSYPKDDPNVEVWKKTIMYSKYYQGPFKGLKTAINELIKYVEEKEKKKPVKLYTWTSNCPKCWEKQGGPVVIIFAKI